MRHVRKQYNRWSFRLSVLGKYVDAGESYIDEMSAGVAADLAKHYLRTEFKFDLAPSLDGEMFSSLAYSRLNVDLSSSYSVERALAPGVKNFVNENAGPLLEHKNAQPPDSLSSKYRRSGAIQQPAIREWVEKLESAEWQAKSFSALNGQYFFSLLDSLSNRLTDSLKPLRLAVKMHEGVTDPLLADRAHKLDVLNNYVAELLTYVVDLTKTLKEEQSTVEGAVAKLEASRPNLS